ncbi:MAG: hypothetical protein ACRD3M_19590, partial [Thermoanaerobaculia bacterium]
MRHQGSGSTGTTPRGVSRLRTPSRSRPDRCRRLGAGRIPPAALAAAFVLAALFLPERASGVATTWTGATSTVWTTAGNWTAGVPGAADTATIPNTVNDPVITTSVTIAGLTIDSGGVLTVDGSLTTGSFTLNSGTLQGSGPVSITGLFDMNFGTMSGTGTTTLASTGTGTFDSNYLTLNRPFVSNGDITLSANGYFNMAAG